MQKYLYGFDTLSKQMCDNSLKRARAVFFNDLALYLFTVIFTFLAIAYNLPSSTFSHKTQSFVYMYFRPRTVPCKSCGLSVFVHETQI